jgi:hypothetical protein
MGTSLNNDTFLVVTIGGSLTMLAVVVVAFVLVVDIIVAVVIVSFTCITGSIKEGYDITTSLLCLDDVDNSVFNSSPTCRDIKKPGHNRVSTIHVFICEGNRSRLERDDK